MEGGLRGFEVRNRGARVQRSGDVIQVHEGQAAKQKSE